MKLLSKIQNVLVAISLLALCSVAIVACSDKDDEPETNNPTANNTGVSSQSWTGNPAVGVNGGSTTCAFMAAGAWTASSSQPWATVTPSEGEAGNASFVIKAEANTGEDSRSAKITISVKGYAEKTVITLIQAGTKPSSSDIDDSTVQGWIKKYMAEKYLWNEPIMGLNPSKSLSAANYLTKLLEGVDALDHMNRDDGHWVDGVRKYWYSNIQSETRSRAGKETGSGVMYMSGAYMDNTQTTACLIPLMVSPNSPAANADIRRGDIIDQINGTNITGANFNSMANKLYDGGITVRLRRIVDNQLTTINASLSLSSSTFTEPGVYFTKIYTSNSGTKIGYIFYSGFEYTLDQELINAFNTLKSNGVTELVLDLRYNGGGHVRSSLLLGTLIAGQSKKDKIYSHTTYNAQRSAKGEEGFYRIGDPRIPEGGNGSYVSYAKITEGLNASLGLNRIYIICSENTASASELVINGLKGLDIDVRLIGTTTNGKNVGMEPTTNQFGSTYYDFAPITFYSQNAKGFKDYSNGFVPDVIFDEDEYWPVEFGLDEPALSLALDWITSGSKPSVSTTRATKKKIMPIANPKANRPSGSIKLTQQD